MINWGSKSSSAEYVCCINEISSGFFSSLATSFSFTFKTAWLTSKMIWNDIYHKETRRYCIMSIKAHELDQVIKTNSNSDLILLTFALLDPTIHLRMICRMKNSFSSRSRNIFSYWHSQPWPWKKLELLNHFEIVEELRLASGELCCSKNSEWFT